MAQASYDKVVDAIDASTINPFSRGERFITKPDGIGDYTFDERYKVTIISRSYSGGSQETLGVETYLQGETIDMQVESQWESLDFFKSTLFEVLAQTTLGTSSKHSYMTRRMWTGSRPIRINIPLKFVALTDARANVLKPIESLQKMVAPSLGPMGFLIPPGPNPFYEDQLTGLIKNVFKRDKSQQMGRVIAIWLGTYLFFPSVIISDIQTSFYNQYDLRGSPTAANVNVIFETYQVYTKEDVSKTFPEIALSGDPSANLNSGSL